LNQKLAQHALLVSEGEFDAFAADTQLLLATSLVTASTFMRLRADVTPTILGDARDA
jgi:hypothetical protein